MSERRACRVLGQYRTTQRHPGQPRPDTEALTAAIVALATQYGRYGYRRIAALVRAEGWTVNVKRVARIWRIEGLKVPQRQPKRGRLWLTDGSCVRLRPERPNHVWAYDFMTDRTHDGRAFRLLTIVDEFTREALAIVVARKLTADDVLAALTDLFITRGCPGSPAVRQRPRVLREDRPGVAGLARGADPVHRAREPLGERLQRILQREAPG